jgi:hypothetical protein
MKSCSANEAGIKLHGTEFQINIFKPFSKRIHVSNLSFVKEFEPDISGIIKTPWPLVRKRTIPTKRPPFVDEIIVPTFVDRGVSRGQRGGTPTAVNLSFLDRSPYFSFK